MSPSLTGIASSSSFCVSPYVSPCAVSSLDAGPVLANSCLTPELIKLLFWPSGYSIVTILS